MFTLNKYVKDNHGVTIHTLDNNLLFWHGARIEDGIVDSHWLFNKRIGYDITNRTQSIFKDGIQFGEFIRTRHSIRPKYFK